MKTVFSNTFERKFRKLDKKVKSKVLIAVDLLSENIHHPSLHAKKIEGKSFWEARVDYHYRLSFEILEDKMRFLTVGMHDEGLGKK